MPQDYNTTLNLPKTDFPMRANLPEKEPEILKEWESRKIYQKLIEKNKDKPMYLLHDGPPYANGDIHLGHALNKILKDFVVRYKNMSGFKAPFVPGWDTHGLPTEIKAMTKHGAEKAKQMTNIELRSLCKEFAMDYVNRQREQFKRLGVFGDWENPYITLQPEYEARQIEVFAKMTSKNSIYRGLRPVHWCPSCETALAEAEIEYQNDKCKTIYVKFKITDDNGRLSMLGADLSNTYFVIWTTTAWTLPGNVAICVGPEFKYALIKSGCEFYVVADELKEKTMEAAGIENFEVITTILGSDLENMQAVHPFLDRKSLVIIGDHVTTESGTGCVHTAPGHGVEDFEICKNYEDLPVLVPVDDRGILTSEAGEFQGMHVSEASKSITKHLEENNLLLASKDITHTYPHCWRCKSAVLFRATKQWFYSVEAFKKQTLEEIENVKWKPSWGKERMISMVSERKDWCISRQRKWGVPLPIFFCKNCGKELIDEKAMMNVAKIFEKEGSDSWFINDAAYFLPKNTVCEECFCTEFTKEKDIMDVWFDSGSSHAAVCAARPDLKWPADLYLEGADQYRGWFQSSLLTAVATKGAAPYKTVVSNGWVVDEEGKKQSKSLGNVVDPAEVINKYGADVLRLWVASVDYHADVKVSYDIIKQLSESYRKIRNTARFIIGNLYDFDPDKNAINLQDLVETDKWALIKLNEIIEKVLNGYENFEFHNVYHAIQKFCIVDMSNFYLDILKDRLYVDKQNGSSRRAAQTTIYLILNALVKLLAPILAHTSEEMWKYIPKSKNENFESIFFSSIPSRININVDNHFIMKWGKIHKIRDGINRILELERKEKTIGSSLEAEVLVYCQGELFDFIKNHESELQTVLMVSNVCVAEKGQGKYNIEDFNGLSVTIKHSDYKKCERCWNHTNSVGESAENPSLCSRCFNVLN